MEFKIDGFVSGGRYTGKDVGFDEVETVEVFSREADYYAVKEEPTKADFVLFFDVDKQEVIEFYIGEQIKPVKGEN